MSASVSVCYTGNEVPKVVKQDRDFTTNGELRALIELVYSYGVRASEIEHILSYRAGSLGYGADLGKLCLVEPGLGVRRRGEGIRLLKEWNK